MSFIAMTHNKKLFTVAQKNTAETQQNAQDTSSAKQLLAWICIYEWMMWEQRTTRPRGLVHAAQRSSGRVAA